MVDLDAPTPQMPNESQIRHFLGANFVLTSTNQQNITLLSNSTPAISNFLQPTPPAGSDPHRYGNRTHLGLIKAETFLIVVNRYVFLLFEQPNDFNSQTFVTADTSTANFNISAFAEETGLGSPIGGTFMLVCPDPST